MSGGWRVGVDVGGTFTDVIAVNRARRDTRIAKVPSRSDDRVAGLLAALRAVDLAWPDVDDLIHGTTLVTNAIVEDDLAEVALVSTRGFSDTLAIGRQNRRHLYRLDLPPKAAPQVPAGRRFEVRERLDHEGQVLEPMDPRTVDEALRRIEESGAAAVAVSLLHSYANPAHEEALGGRLRERFPFVALSSPGQSGGPGVRAHRDDGAERRVDAAGRELPRPDRGGQAGGLQAAPVPLRRGHGLAGGVARAAARPRRLGSRGRRRRGRTHRPGPRRRARHQLRHGAAPPPTSA